VDEGGESVVTVVDSGDGEVVDIGAGEVVDSDSEAVLVSTAIVVVVGSGSGGHEIFSVAFN